jgi:hypothetical protein
MAQMMDPTPMLQSLYEAHREGRKDIEIAYVQGQSAAKARAMRGGHKPGSEGFEQAMSAVDRQYQANLRSLYNEGAFAGLKKWAITSGNDYLASASDKVKEEFFFKLFDPVAHKLQKDAQADFKQRKKEYRDTEKQYLADLQKWTDNNSIGRQPEKPKLLDSPEPKFMMDIKYPNMSEVIQQELKDAGPDAYRIKNNDKFKLGVQAQTDRMIGSAAKLESYEDEETGISWAV